MKIFNIIVAGIIILLIICFGITISVSIAESKKNYNVSCHDINSNLIYEGNSQGKPDYLFWDEIIFKEQSSGKKIIITKAKCILKEL